jgi:heat shock protein HslJ
MIRLCLIFLLFLTACQKDETVAGQTSPDTVWVLNRIDDAPMDLRFTIQFQADGHITGQAPCNSYTGTQTAPLPWISFGPIAATRRACPDLWLEAEYFEALGKMAFVEVLGDRMLMTSEEGITMEFKWDGG